MMNNLSNRQEEKDFGVWISRILRIGVLTSATVIILGGILFAIQHPDAVFSFKSFAGEPERLRNAGEIFREAHLLRSRSVIQLGILVLIATPVLRVIFSFIEFLIHRDCIYVLITAIVITTLFYSLFG
jgi:uncharacterized membrane protein